MNTHPFMNPILMLFRIAGYTWYKTHLTIGHLRPDEPKRTQIFLEHKISELHHASIIGALLASIIAGALSFPQIEDTHWLVHACWYTALTLVVTSVLVGFQQTSGLGAVLVTGDPEDVYLSLVDSKRRAQWKVVFVLQVPVQLLSYAIFLWTIGLSVYVFYPLVRGERGAAMRVGICYAVGLAASMILFIVSSGFSLGLLDKLGERVEKQGTSVREEEGEAKKVRE